MKSRLIIVMSILCTFFAVGCSNNKTNPALQGFYQCEMKNGYSVQFSFENEEDTFVGYINNIEINKGTYEAMGDGKYILKGEKENLEITLDKEDYFNLDMKNLSEKLNENKPIQMKNIDKTPTYFEQVFSEEDKKAVESLVNDKKK